MQLSLQYENVYQNWAFSNKITQDLTGLDLSKYNYLLNENKEMIQ